MRWVGTGPELFSARVDLFAPDGDSRWVSRAYEALTQLLPFSDSDERSLAGADQGRGHEGSAVVGLTFLVRATDFGNAAQIAVATATAAATKAGLTGQVYDLVLVPEAGLSLPATRSIALPD